MDTRITKSTQDGYYVVLLFDIDHDKIFLCLAAGWTQFEKEFGTRLGRKRVIEIGGFYGSKLSDKFPGFKVGPINLEAKGPLAKGYEADQILTKYHDLDSLDAEILNADINNLLGAYDELKALAGNDILNFDITNFDEKNLSAFRAELAQGTLRDDKAGALADLIATIEAAPPKRREVLRNELIRNKTFAAYVKERENYVCEICGRKPFKQKKGSLYAEADHIIPIGGITMGDDHPDNMRCLCSQCHAVITHGSDEEIEKIIFSDGESIPN